jgi:spore germination protein (amino acid permease)
MFSDNNKISLRQTFRLFTFDFIGVGTLVLPPYLSKQMGIYGVFGILLGGLFGLAYLVYLGWCIKLMGTDLLTAMSKRRILCAYLSFSCIVTAADIAAIFGEVIRKTLLQEGNYILILFLILLTACYLVSGGIESRARVYEILFWIVLIPLFLMLALALKDMDIVYLFPQMEFSVKNLFSGGYAVFLTFGTLFFALFFPRYLTAETKAGQLLWFVGSALGCGVGILAVLYVILTGTFGQAALGEMEFPAVSLMSLITFSGGFFKRLDAVMMGVWFFTLYAVLSLNLFYGYELLQKATGTSRKKIPLAVTALLAFVLAEVLHENESALLWCQRYFRYVGMPVYVLLPGIFALRGGRENKN